MGNAQRLTPSRLLLLLLLLAGVTGMHTMGHPVTHDTAGPMHSSSAIHSDMGHSMGDGTTDDHAPRFLMNPLDTCLAVLVALMLFWLAAAWCLHRRDVVGPFASALGRRRQSRDPPVFMMLGLRIADLSVRRT